ncbi:protein of unknown function DUF187 [Gloeothece citriformis PCC 7424]|uniref:Glycosyl hydrolase-like 10 domain-containing protein n=1 Tax=Gloeothece citriformis (strain PCC 7424) TaxID=65393 RepID=B7K9Q2_GLOC7|nr:glycoside hydrolase family 10 protein [Gloeothece citriformis]ACK70020.1 protein of unknown function DUF187 [Gloeothece citriformis PCC 7424]
MVKPSRFLSRQFKIIICFALGLLLWISTLLIPSPNYSLNPSTELRGVWLTNIDSDVLFKPKNLSNAIDTLSQLNFNTLYPTVWNWGYTLYPSQVAKRTIGIELDPAEGLQKRDILKETIKQAHKKGMAVIPWFEFGFMAPADSELAKRHPEWLTQRQDGTTIWWEGKVHQRVWLNPLHPEVQQFITDLVVEIVSKYDVDGIQFDDHFGYPSELGYDPFTVNLYQQEHGGKLPPSNPKDTAWIQWRADKITDYMAQLFRTIKETNPKVLVSVSPNPQKFSLEAFLLDWKTWEEKRIVDELVIQVYRHDNNSFNRELSQPELQEAKENIPVGIGVLTGLKGRHVPMDRIKTQVETTRKQGFAGVSFFFYESLWELAQELPKQRQSALQALFSSPIQRPTVSENRYGNL